MNKDSRRRLPLNLHYINKHNDRKMKNLWYSFIGLIIICCLTLCVDWINFPNIVYADTIEMGIHSVKVITLNMHDGYDENGQNNLTKTLAFLESEKPDIIFLQEVEPQKLKILKTAGYKIVTGMNHNLFRYHFGNAILTRHPIIYHRHHYLPSSKEQRGLDEAAINVNGNPLIVLGTHLGLGRIEQENQFREIERIITYLRGPIILSGDFNVPASDQLFVDFKKYFTEIGQKIPLSDSFPTSNPKERLDQIWYNHQWHPMTAQTLDWDGSDHRPVEAELALDTLSSPITKQKISEVIPVNNPLLPNVDGSLSTISLSVPSNPKSHESKPGGYVDLPLTNPLHISVQSVGSDLGAALHYNIATFDFRDYISKWRNFRGKGKWSVSLARDSKDQTWLSWEQYYRWNDFQGTAIAVSNRENKMNYGIEQTSLISKQFGWSIGLDTKEKLSLGMCFSPDQKNAIEIKWYPVDSERNWQFQWKYQYQ